MFGFKQLLNQQILFIQLNQRLKLFNHDVFGEI